MDIILNSHWLCLWYPVNYDQNTSAKRLTTYDLDISKKEIKFGNDFRTRYVSTFFSQKYGKFSSFLITADALFASKTHNA